MAKAVDLRVRFAPSPTGSLHIGGARTALFNWLFARKHNGKFILRIEDTDQARSTRESEEGILRDFQWLGFDWDEGPNPNLWPEHTGDKGPYRQTDRETIYHQWIKKLLEMPDSPVYWCVCLESELEAKRKAALARGETPRYDGTCFGKSESELNKILKEDKRRLPALRFHVPIDRGTILVNDLVKGEVLFDVSTIGDFVILKSPKTGCSLPDHLPCEGARKIYILNGGYWLQGIPSYNFACIIDDYLMEVSHVIRGDEHLVNTPRQLMLYEALGWEPPKFAHLSMILAPDHSKLSKRHGTTAVSEFRDQGFLPSALLNYVALLGWSPGTTQEIWPLEELVKEFSLERISKNPAIFDINKLKWFNSQYIKEVQPLNVCREIAGAIGSDETGRISVTAQIAQKYKEAFLIEKWEPQDAVLEHVVMGTRDKITLLTDIPKEVHELIGGSGLEEDAKASLTQDGVLEVLKAFLEVLENSNILDPNWFKEAMKQVQVKTGRKGKDLYMPVRAVISGKLHGSELVHLVPVQLARYGKEGLIDRCNRILFQCSNKPNWNK